MLRYMLDTNVCIEVMRRPTEKVAAKFAANAHSIAISTITLHELVHGADRSRRPEYQHELISDLTARLQILAFDAAASHQSGNIHATLASTGRIIGAYDMLIAGHARSLALIVITNNLREFTRVEGLRCEDWLAA
jgi:tRNA(fMet)-specific endonuclease VapC